MDKGLDLMGASFRQMKDGLPAKELADRMVRAFEKMEALVDEFEATGVDPLYEEAAREAARKVLEPFFELKKGVDGIWAFRMDEELRTAIRRGMFRRKEAN